MSIRDLTLEGCYAEDDSRVTLRGRCYPTDTENVVPLPRLTVAMRAWLNDPEKRRWLTKDVTVGFCREFNLTPWIGGLLLGEWVKEQEWVAIPSWMRRDAHAECRAVGSCMLLAGDHCLAECRKAKDEGGAA